LRVNQAKKRTTAKKQQTTAKAAIQTTAKITTAKGTTNTATAAATKTTTASATTKTATTSTPRPGELPLWMYANVEDEYGSFLDVDKDNNAFAILEMDSMLFTIRGQTLGDNTTELGIVILKIDVSTRNASWALDIGKG
jgi:phage repressor protein C with HTH and peptisase S24 domain